MPFVEAAEEENDVEINVTLQQYPTESATDFNNRTFDHFDDKPVGFITGI